MEKILKGEELKFKNPLEIFEDLMKRGHFTKLKE